MDEKYTGGHGPQNNADPKAMNKAYPVSKRADKSRGGVFATPDIDVTPMMNMFMILIPFLVSMAVFTQIAVVDFSLPPSVAAQEQSDEPARELDISIVVTQSGFSIVGTGRKLDMVTKVKGVYQYNQLRALLKAVKFQYPSQKSVVLVFDQEVLYDDIIKFMDICRESQFPDIGLSGDIG